MSAELKVLGISPEESQVSSLGVSVITSPDLSLSVVDHKGEDYSRLLSRIHFALQPRNYFEIGTFTGATLALSKSKTIAVDPNFSYLRPDLLTQIIAKPQLSLFQSTSDDYFRNHSPTDLFYGPIEFAFLDGMHRCEYLLRDFINTEKYCVRNSIIAMHDCLPVELPMTARLQSDIGAPIVSHRAGWWTGDVWRTALFLKRRRPDLHIHAIDASSTGLIIITNLDPFNATLSDYAQSFKEMMSYSLQDIGINGLYSELEVVSSSNYDSDEKMTSKFWVR